MNEEIQLLINRHGDPNGWNTIELGMIPDEYDLPKGIRYLEKFFIGYEELYETYMPKIEKLSLPQRDSLKRHHTDPIFQEGFSYTIKEGGYPLDDVLWDRYCNVSRELGGSEIIVVEHLFENSTLSKKALRLRFPVDTSWETVLSGNVFSVPLCWTDYYPFYIFDDTGEWGVFFSAEYWFFAFDFIGFRPEHESVFRKYFRQTPRDMEIMAHKDVKNLPLEHAILWPEES